jgi:hypothetical protein
MALGHHLGTDEYSIVPSAKAIEDRSDSSPSLDGVTVEHGNRDARKHLAEALLDALGAGTNRFKGVFVALLALFGNAAPGSAVVAHQSPVLAM